MATSTLLQYGLSAIGPVLVVDLNITSAVYGSMFTVYFTVCAIGSFVLGSFAERLGVKRSNYSIYLCAIAGLLLCVIPGSLFAVYLGIFLSGIAGALANPATNLLLLSLKRRRVGVAIKQSGVQISTIIAGFAVLPLADRFGWRIAFLLLALVAMVLLVALVFTYLGPEAEPYASASEARGGAFLPWFSVYALLMGSALAMTIGYLPLFSFSLLGSETLSGVSLAVFGVFASSGRILWGVLGERVSYFANAGRTLILLSSLALFAVCLFVGAITFEVWLLVPGAVLMGLSGAAWNGVVMASIMEYSPRGSTSRTTGRVQAAFFVGMGLTPGIFGYLVDIFGGYLPAWGVAGLIYAVAIAVAALKINPIIARSS